jgi:hypothetical protein
MGLVGYGALIGMLVVIPLVVGALLNRSAFKGMTPLSYQCGRCKREFRRLPYRGFPRRCPHCKARDWSAASP